jgi:hypothetical protein
MPAAPPVAEEITVGLVGQAAADLAATRQRRGLSRTDITNRALSLYEFIDSALDAGSEVLVRDKAGNEQSVHLL